MLIGLTGYKRCGKDTVADILVEKANMTKYSFAHKLKLIMLDLYDIPLSIWDCDLKDKIIPKYGKTPRQMIIDVGTHGCRRAYDNVWVDFLLRSINNRAVIQDVRFPNEAKSIINAGGKIIRIERPNTELGKDIITTGLYDYPELVHYVIKNDGNLRDLYSKTLKLYRKIENA